MMTSATPTSSISSHYMGAQITVGIKLKSRRVNNCEERSLAAGRRTLAEGIRADLLSWRTLRAEKVERLKKLKASLILLSAIQSRSATTVAKMAVFIKLEVPMLSFLSAFGTCQLKAALDG